MALFLAFLTRIIVLPPEVNLTEPRTIFEFVFWITLFFIFHLKYNPFYDG